MLETSLAGAFLLWWMWSGSSASAAQWVYRGVHQPYAVWVAYLAVFGACYTVVMVPLSWFGGWFLERRFNVSRQPLAAWGLDYVKGALLGYAIAAVLVCAFLAAVRTFVHTWWLVSAILWVLISVVLARLAPLVIIPLFFKYTPLKDEAQRSRIRHLAEAMGVRILDVYEINFSAKSLKANAALVGWGKSRRVLLADTLRQNYTDEEIDAVLAHEFAHQRLRHIPKLLAMQAALTLAVCYLIFVTSDTAMVWFGIKSLWDAAVIPLVTLYFGAASLIMQPLTNWLSRRMEAHADRMAVQTTGNQGAFVSLMEKLAAQNLSVRNPHPVIKIIFYDHPPVDERIAAVQKLSSAS